MRSAFFRELIDLAAVNERIHLVVGDLGFGAVEPFAGRFPDRFLNAGVAEQSMTGVAAGLALCGKIVFTYSIGNFPTLRCLEQIRNDVCYHQANVKIVAVGGGLAYGSLGMTHHATEDLAMMRALPGMIVVAPGDPWEVEQATRAIAAAPGPCYLRLGRVGEPRLHGIGEVFQLGRGIRIRAGRDLTIMSTGGLLESALGSAAQLAAVGIEARVVSMHTVKPLDETEVAAAAADTGAIVTLEEHSLIGGLGSAVAEILAESTGPPARLKRFALPSAFVGEAGSQEYLRERYGLSPKAVVETIQSWL
jgi:transketolase